MSLKGTSQISKIFHKKTHFCAHTRKVKIKNYNLDIFKTNQEINLYFYDRYAPLLKGGVIIEFFPLFPVQAEGNVFKLLHSVN